jgi:hypothetical protein
MPGACLAWKVDLFVAGKQCSEQRVNFVQHQAAAAAAAAAGGGGDKQWPHMTRSSM